MTDQPTTPAPVDTEQPAEQTIEHVGVEPEHDETPAADEPAQDDDAVQLALPFEDAGDQ